MEIITPQQMDKIDANCEKLGIPRILLMENAGRAVAEHLKNQVKEIINKKVVIVAGTGNNGGDGFVAARHLAGYGAKVNVILLGRDLKTEEAAINWRGLNSMTQTVKLLTINNNSFSATLQRLIRDADLIIDAILGTGIKGKLKEPYSKAIDLINWSTAYVLSVDVPSGLNPLTGEVHEKCVTADATVTFHKLKVGLMKRQDITGELFLAPIGIPPEAEQGV